MDMRHNMFILKWPFNTIQYMSQKFPDWVNVTTSGLPSLQVNTVLFKMPDPEPLPLGKTSLTV
jgi:hypothetical protein